MRLHVRVARLLDRATREVAMSLSYAVNFRGYQACPCLAEWLPVFEAELQRRGLLTGPLRIYQLIGGAVASGGTHATGGAFDLLDLPGDKDWWVARQMGADASWSRRFNWDGRNGMAHFHGVLTGCPHNGPARYQIADVQNDMNGLAGSHRAKDDGPRPLSGRTWQEGIAWAKQQQEENEMTPEQSKALAEIRADVAAVRRMQERQRARQLAQTQRIIRRLDGLADGASAEDVRKVRADIGELAAAFALDED